MLDDLTYLKNYQNLLNAQTDKFKEELFKRGFMLNEKNKIVLDKDIYVAECLEIYSKKEKRNAIYEITKDNLIDLLRWHAIAENINNGVELTDDEYDAWDDINGSYELSIYEDEEDDINNIYVEFYEGDIENRYKITREDELIEFEVLMRTSQNRRIEKGSKYIFRKGKLSELKDDKSIN